jgi:hypothetical protein
MPIVLEEIYGNRCDMFPGDRLACDFVELPLILSTGTFRARFGALPTKGNIDFLIAC